MLLVDNISYFLLVNLNDLADIADRHIIAYSAILFKNCYDTADFKSRSRNVS